jgi:hypothetical protein
MRRRLDVRARRRLRIAAYAGATVVFVASALEVALVKASEYRASHGNGRERTFVKGASP